MAQVVVIGCGVVGAMLAYELSLAPELSVVAIDRGLPGRGSTSAALGVLMGAISHKIKGRLWQMRQMSLERYETLIPELESLTQTKILYNRQGILKLCLLGEDLNNWEKLTQFRQKQGYRLEIWDLPRLKSNCPQLNCQQIEVGIYSGSDRQVDPVALTEALILAGKDGGVKYEFETGIEIDRQKKVIKTKNGLVDWDYLVISAGLGSAELASQLQQTLPMEPVLGQAIQVHLPEILGNPGFQPVITADDVHIVPWGGTDYYIGATVEFPQNGTPPIPDPEQLEFVRQKAIAICPQIAEGKIIRSWSGLRPRPVGQPAPIIRQHPEENNILFATGHYRNGVLLAPATAILVRQVIRGDRFR
ncbi:NAD(P)/FAD-dependent oxidoreductase [Merismopedia glauca]|uniref:FAD-dependent oxidoreductase n=1 Tax=Merismopedia glauca CCAP 1448/3 TaxID=1296344 RepID=A0A2T1C1K6_9CYAN|nr:FAD-dependent oxidoreductase [Merismopedia glauca]PSB02003.1 FAD-dependent oxidoreductase [Merismopedia glauca CCAP 1448/3]